MASQDAPRLDIGLYLLTTHRARCCPSPLNYPKIWGMKNDTQTAPRRRRTHWLDPAREEITVFLVAGGAAVVFLILALIIGH